MSIYREGNVISETRGTSSGTFETSTGMPKSESDGLTYVRIQMISTPSGLRYMQSHPSGVGTTIGGPVTQSYRTNNQAFEGHSRCKRNV